MAESEDGELVDPYGGQADLAARVLRHVSEAFVEDPVRVLRVARFAARYADLGFRVADETVQLMQRMTQGGEVSALVAERVWQETERALGESRPEVFFETLRACGALAADFPDVAALFRVAPAARSLAESSGQRGGGRAADRGPQCAPQGPERAPRAGGPHRPPPHPRAPRRRAEADNDPHAAGELRRLSPPGALCRAAAGV